MKITLSALFIFAIINLFSIDVWSQNRIPAFEMNDRLGRGVNMGNSFEAPSETAWGNPWKAEYFEIMADIGFDHVRLPVRWEPADRSMATSPYTINSTFMERIQEVVDEALKNKLHIIVNMHHHEALFDDPDGQKERFLSMWNQVATHFQDYPDSLLFEVLNEPHGNLTPDMWNVFFADALAEIRLTNPSRVVLMGVADYGGLGGIVDLDLPDDEYIIVSPHYYNPFSFTHQGAEWVDNSDPWLGTEWLDTEIDRETVESEFNYALQFSEENHIPIHVGEFGAYSKADIESRERWTTFLGRWFEEQGLSWAYWEFSAGFGIYDPDTRNFVDPLVDALFNNEMPDPIPVYKTTVYTSDFSSGTDGWSLNTQGGASGSLSASNNALNITLTNGGTEGWHVQLVKSDIPLEKDEMYRISFKAKAEANRSASFNAGKASNPWNSYSGYNGISITTAESEYVFSFTMSDATDLAARLVFDLGKDITAVAVSDVKVEKLSFTSTITAVDEPFNQHPIKYYPNPVSSVLQIPEMDHYEVVSVHDISGRTMTKLNVNPTKFFIDMNDYPRGIYLINLSGNGLHDHIKIMKE